MPSDEDPADVLVEVPATTFIAAASIVMLSWLARWVGSIGLVVWLVRGRG